MTKVSLSLPWPPSVNRHVRAAKRGVYTSREWRDYLQAGVLIGKRCQRLGKARVAVEILLYPPTRRRCDIDNRVKILLDVIERSGIIADDSQVDILHVERREVAPPGRADVTVRETGERSEI